MVILSVGSSHGDGIETRRMIFISLTDPALLLQHRNAYFASDGAQDNLDQFLSWLSTEGVEVKEGPRGCWGMDVIDDVQRAANAEVRRLEASAHLDIGCNSSLFALSLPEAA